MYANLQVDCALVNWNMKLSDQNIICKSIILSAGASWLVLQVITLFHQPFLGWRHENVGKANHHMPFHENRVYIWSIYTYV